jgi:hypothetical protein
MRQQRADAIRERLSILENSISEARRQLAIFWGLFLEGFFTIIIICTIGNLR